MTPFQEMTLENEKEKIRLDYERLRVESNKTKWNLLTITTPVLVAMLTIGFGMWANHRQSEREFKVALVQALLAQNSPKEALAKLRFFMEVFPDQVDARTEVDMKRFSGPDTERKIRFLEMVANSNLPGEYLRSIWAQLYPDDLWARRGELTDALASGREVDAGKAEQGDLPEIHQ